jgi:transposase
MSDRKSYSDETKEEAIKMVKVQGLSQVEVSKKLTIPKGTIGNWVSGIGLGKVIGKPGDQSVSELKAENVKLRKELAESRMEREILKKAAAYFAKESLHGTRL